MLSDVFFPVSSRSESSEEDSAGEKEEEIGQHNEVTCSTKTTEVPAELTSNAQTGEGWRKDIRLCVCLLFPCPSLNSNMGGANYDDYIQTELGFIMSLVWPVCWL